MIFKNYNLKKTIEFLNNIFILIFILFTIVNLFIIYALIIVGLFNLMVNPATIDTLDLYTGYHPLLFNNSIDLNGLITSFNDVILDVVVSGEATHSEAVTVPGDIEHSAGIENSAPNVSRFSADTEDFKPVKHYRKFVYIGVAGLGSLAFTGLMAVVNYILTK